MAVHVVEFCLGKLPRLLFNRPERRWSYSQAFLSSGSSSILTYSRHSFLENTHQALHPFSNRSSQLKERSTSDISSSDSNQRYLAGPKFIPHGTIFAPIPSGSLALWSRSSLPWHPVFAQLNLEEPRLLSCSSNSYGRRPHSLASWPLWSFVVATALIVRANTKSSNPRGANIHHVTCNITVFCVKRGSGPSPIFRIRSSWRIQSCQYTHLLSKLGLWNASAALVQCRQARHTGVHLRLEPFCVFAAGLELNSTTLTLWVMIQKPTPFALRAAVLELMECRAPVWRWIKRQQETTAEQPILSRPSLVWPLHSCPKCSIQSRTPSPTRLPASWNWS